MCRDNVLDEELPKTQPEQHRGRDDEKALPQTTIPVPQQEACEQCGLERHLPSRQPVVFAAQKAKIINRVIPPSAERPDMIDLEMNGRSASDTVHTDVCAAPIVASEYGVSYACRDMPRASVCFVFPIPETPNELLGFTGA